MDPEEPARRALGAGYKYVSMGIAFAGGIVMFMGLGWVLDGLLGTLPVFLIAGALAGAVLSFTWVYMRLRQDEVRYRVEHKNTWTHGRLDASGEPGEPAGDSDEARWGDSPSPPPEKDPE